MLELRPVCEHCGKPLPPGSTEAMICSFECTFCATCVEDVLQNVCPNCGGGFEKRPVRPKAALAKHPAGKMIHLKPVSPEHFAPLKDSVKDVPPDQR